MINKLNRSVRISLRHLAFGGVGVVVGDCGEHKLAVGPEPEHGAQAKADNIRTDVVRQRTVRTHQVVAKPQAPDRNQHRDTVEPKEHQVLATYIGAPTVPERPIPIAQVGDGGRDRNAEDLGRNWSVVHGTLAIWSREPQKVEKSNVNHECG